MIKAQLVAQLADVLSETTSGGQPITAAAKAQAIADIIDAYIRTATVTINSFTATAICNVGPPGIVSGTATGTLS
jgi:hypothetical protein